MKLSIVWELGKLTATFLCLPCEEPNRLLVIQIIRKMKKNDSILELQKPQLLKQITRSSLASKKWALSQLITILHLHKLLCFGLCIDQFWEYN